MSLEKSAVSSKNFCQCPWFSYCMIKCPLLSPSWYRLTRPKATFRQIKTYFASCLFDWRPPSVGIVPGCGSLTEICFLKPSAALVLYFVFFWSKDGTGRVDPERQQPTQRKTLKYFSLFQDAEMFRHHRNLQTKGHDKIHTHHDSVHGRWWVEIFGVKQVHVKPINKETTSQPIRQQRPIKQRH